MVLCVDNVQICVIVKCVQMIMLITDIAFECKCAKPISVAFVLVV